MSDQEKECVLMWDVMSIKVCLLYNSKHDLVEGYADLGNLGWMPKIGNHVLVGMLSGRQNDYYVSKESVKVALLKDIIPAI